MGLPSRYEASCKLSDLMRAATCQGGRAVCAAWLESPKACAGPWYRGVLRTHHALAQLDGPGLGGPHGQQRLCTARSARAAGFRCACSTAGGAPERKRVVFLGTPDVAALVLRRLLDAASGPGASFEVAAVVSQPGKPRGRGNKKVPQPTPVEELAAAEGFAASGRLLCPESARDPGFLDALRALRPHLAVTAAYGNYLPPAFLAIPPHGTLNIHPSLLPRYRGAAPVQRSLQDGVEESGVSVLYTVRAMDAGPLLAQRSVAVGPDERAPELLSRLFHLGADLLLDALPEVWAGRGAAGAAPQDDAAASHAPKLRREEAGLDFGRPAAEVHNHVRAFVGWPGTTASFEVREDGGGGAAPAEVLELKVLRTRLAEAAAGDWAGSGQRAVQASREGLLVRCGDGAVVQLLEVQPPGKRAMPARDFVNGLHPGRSLFWRPPQEAAAA